MARGLENKKVVMIIPPRMFRDEELFIPKEHLESKGVEVIVASTEKGKCVGAGDHEINIEMTLDEVDAPQLDAVLFVGGPGTPPIRKEARALEIAREAAQKGKALGAICWAVTTLAKAGVLEGKKATVWYGPDSEYGTTTDKVLAKYGCTYVPQGVVADGKIVSADGPRNAKKYAEEIEKILLSV
ncbi:MAG: DJ-1/PfpI family protein [Candidatus Bilamarchaeaceae archaeon]